MSTDVVVETLRERRRSLLWWSLGLAALVALNVAFYPSIRDDEALSDYAKDLPESVRALFAGGELDLPVQRVISTARSSRCWRRSCS